MQDDNTLKAIASAVVAKGNETEMQRLAYRQEDILAKLKNMKESFKAQATEQETMKALLASIARHIGMDYEEEDNEL